jgi:hypothetical protein
MCLRKLLIINDLHNNSHEPILGQIVERSKNRSPCGYRYRCAPAGYRCLRRNQYHGLIDLLLRLARVVFVRQNSRVESDWEIKRGVLTSKR